MLVFNELAFCSVVVAPLVTEQQQAIGWGDVGVLLVRRVTVGLFLFHFPRSWIGCKYDTGAVNTRNIYQMLDQDCF